MKKGTIRFPFALVPEAALARNVGCDAGASTPTYCELIFQLAHYQRGVGAAEAEAVADKAEAAVAPAAAAPAAPAAAAPSAPAADK